MNPRPEVSFEMLQKLLDSISVSAYTFDKNRRIIYANESAKKALRADAPNVAIGAAQSDHFKYHKYYDVDSNLLPYPKDSAVERALRGEETHDLLIEHRNLKDRKHEWICISCVPVTDERGDFQYGMLWYEDISERKSRDDKLKFLLESAKILSLTSQFEERLQQKAKLAVPNLADWCSIELANDDGTTTRQVLVHRDPAKLEWIKELEKKYPRDSAIESATERVIRTGKAEFIPYFSEEMWEKILDEAPNVTEEMRKDVRDLQLVSLMVLPIGTRGNILGALTLAYAESGRQYTENDFEFFQEFSYHLGVLLENARLYAEISQRDLAKDAFLASLSHELRNPLAPIKSAMELLRIQNRDQNLEGELDIIDHQFDHMARLLNDLLDATRYIRGKITLDIEPLELSALTRSAVNAMQPLAKDAGIELKVAYPSGPLLFLGDRMRLEQAITNILGNAIKFTPRGGSISIEHQGDGESMRLVVSDTGAGITADEMRHIFEPYYQGERLRGGNTGLGVGLRLVHEIVRLHGGEISAKSEGPDKGSEFTLSLPARTDVERTNEHRTTIDLSKPGKRILVVDDNKAATDSLVRLLNALGSQAQGFYSAREVIAYLDTNDADLIFLDISMPEMNGYELVRHLRAKGHARLPIIAVTGYGLEDDRRRALNAGFTAHLTKPIGTKEIHQILEKIGS